MKIWVHKTNQVRGIFWLKWQKNIWKFQLCIRNDRLTNHFVEFPFSSNINCSKLFSIDWYWLTQNYCRSSIVYQHETVETFTCARRKSEAGRRKAYKRPKTHCIASHYCISFELVKNVNIWYLQRRV